MYQARIYGTSECNMSLVTRQNAANKDHAICYVEQHLNSFNASANHGMALIALNGSMRSLKWANNYCILLQSAMKGLISFAHPKRLASGERGGSCIKYTNMPAILTEPLFVSNPSHVTFLRTGGVRVLAQVLANSIMSTFPDGGLVALSIGHGYRGKLDAGAPVVGAIGDECETYYNEKIIIATAEILQKGGA